MKEVGVVELAILVRVEELQDEIAIGLVDLHIAVVSHEIDHIKRGYEAILVSVNSTE